MKPSIPEAISYNLDERTFRQLVWKHYGDYLRMQLRLFTGPATIILGIIFATAFMFDRRLPLLGIVLIAFGLHMLFSRYLMVNKVIKAWRRLPDSSKRTTISIDQNRLCFNTDITDVSFEGEMIVKVRNFEIGFLVYLSRQHFIGVPRSAFENEARYQEWINAIVSLAGLEGSKAGWK